MQSIVLHKTIIANENVYVFFEWNKSCVSNIIKKFHIFKQNALNNRYSTYLKYKLLDTHSDALSRQHFEYS